ncbi:MAG: hypothetical protein QXJ50_03690 [Candidatus Woesearchaeota archaeon]
MYSLYDLRGKIREHFKFSQLEIRALLITILTSAFILSFRQWGGATFDFSAGLRNLFNAFLIITLSLLFKVSVQKIYALHIGYKLEYQFWLTGILTSLFLCFLTNGWLPILMLGGFAVTMLPGHRLGYFRYNINYFSLGIIAMMGPVANLILALFFKFFSGLPSPLIPLAIKFNVLMAFFSMLPIPPLDGSKVLYAARPLYAFSLAAVLATGLLILLLKSIPLIIIGGLLIGILSWAYYFFNYEMK